MGLGGATVARLTSRSEEHSTSSDHGVVDEKLRNGLSGQRVKALTPDLKAACQITSRALPNGSDCGVDEKCGTGLGGATLAAV
ncbi:hypothetical protein AVEN_18951-1 [Araneus ventricosus]|uniref:Uncharacterized protein n=1 Tax=Araneus ventricosus TaxID=182803 RepID=A0A4Y2QYT6_ARAVE|nr:hypothetical protein AVEN_18951-1 [Araneus ventricosus]